MESIPLIIENNTDPQLIEDKLCRYCLEPVEDSFKYCNCTGSHGHLHHECLVKWYESNNFNVIKCELCHSDFKIQIIQSNRKEEIINTIKILFILFFFITVNAMTLFIIPSFIDKEIDTYNIYNVFKLTIFIGSLMILSMVFQVYKNTKKYTLIQTLV